MKFATLIATGTAVLGLAIAAPAFAKDVVNFGIISTESSQNLKSQWVPFIEAMEQQTGLEVKAFFASDYAGIIEGMRFGKVQIAWYGNKSAMEAVDRANGEVFVQSVYANGELGYYSHLIAPASSKLTSAEDMLRDAANLTFSNGDPNSTSGFLIPGYYVFAKNGVEDPKKIFKRTINANHETNAMAVANGQVDVATVSSEVLANVGKRQPDKHANIKVIWTSPLIPNDPIVWRTDLDAGTKEKLRTFFLTYGVAGNDKSAGQVAKETEVLAALTWAPFRLSTNDQLNPIRELELFKARGKVQGDTSLSADEKKAKLDEIDAQLEVLKQKLAAK